MKNQERLSKYIKENCSRCKNKNGNDCEIRIFKNEDTIYTKCANYEKGDNL